jgi:hypothetical protein
VSALWSSLGTASASVTAGRVQFAQTGFDALSTVFGSTEASRVAAAPVTVTNTGTVPADFTLQPGAESANDVARAVKVSVWRVRAVADCTTAAPVPAGVTTIDWPALPAVTGSLTPSASAVYCFRSAISAADVSAFPGGSMVATLRLTAAVGSWTSETTARATQSIAPAGSDASPMPSPTPMPAPIAPVSLESVALTRAYEIQSFASGWCVAADGMAPGGSRQGLIEASCDGSGGQSWQFSDEEDGSHRIVTAATDTAATDTFVAWTAEAGAVRLASASEDAAQLWSTRSNPDGSATFVSAATGDCVTASPDSAAGGLPQPLTLADCDGSAAQAFTLTEQS